MISSTVAWAVRYIQAYQFKLVPVPRGCKGPIDKGWNTLERYIEDVEKARQRWSNGLNEGIGVVLGPSGLCSVDVDSVAHAERVLGELGIDLPALRQGVPTIIGNPERYRLMFSAPPGAVLSRKALAWPAQNPGEKPHTLFELRAGKVQDVLPPTEHPDFHTPYVWQDPPDGGFPPLPEVLLELWASWASYKIELESMCPWTEGGFNPKSAPRGPGAQPKVIAAFNQAHSVEDLLERHEYTRKGNRWLSPTSSTKLAGVVVLDDGRVYSHHGSDPLFDEHSHDAFDLFRILGHGGDTTSAVKAAAEELGIEYSRRESTSEYIHENVEEAPRTWPVLPAAALSGIFKEIVEVSTERSEADPAAVLVTALAFASATIGTAPFMWVGDTRHFARLYTVLVGASSRARKGTSRDPVWRIFHEAEKLIHGKNTNDFPLGLKLVISPGPLSSGEGLVYAVRDPSDATDKEGQPLDLGVADKRLLVGDGEFGAALRAAQRDGSTLSAILRSGWDHGNIAPLTKNNRIRATDAHINFVAHITLEELRKLLESVDLWNGFANRILWAAVRRSGQESRPRPIPKDVLFWVAQRLSRALMEAVACGEMNFGPEAAELWDSRYANLTEDHSGALGAVTARGEAQVLRLALLHTVMDPDATDIGVVHLEAALATWEYCFASARYIFGDAEADPEVNKLLVALRDRDMSLTDINGLFYGHKSTAVINEMLARLQAAGRVTIHEERSGPLGRAKTTVSLRK